MSMPGIVIRIGADTKDAIDGLNKVEKALGRSLTPTEKLGRVMDKTLAPALIAVGAAAGAFAIKLGVDAVQAALEDEAAMAGLAKTLDNLGFAPATKQVESFITAQQKATGVTDTEMRPAFERLVRSTESVGEAQDALVIAMDASAATGKSLEAVSNAMGKAYDGNFQSLVRLGLGIDQSILKTKDMSLVTAELARLTAGQAATAAQTYQGRINLIKVAADEAAETIGYALLDAIFAAGDAMGGPGGLTSYMEDTAQSIADVIGGTTLLIKKLDGLVGATEDVTVAQKELNKRQFGWKDLLAGLRGPLYGVARGLQLYESNANNANRATQALTDRMNGLAAAAVTAQNAMAAATRVTDATASTWNAGYVTQAKQATELAKRQDAAAEAAKRLAAATTGSSSGSGSSGAAGGVKELSKAAKAAQEQFAALETSVKDTSTALGAAQSEIDAAWVKMREGGEAYADWLTSGISLGAAINEAAASAGTANATTYMDAFLAQIKNVGDANAAMKALSDSLVAAGVDKSAGQALIAQLMTLPPGAAATVATDLVTNGLAPELARKLGEVNLFAGQAGVTWSNQWTDSGVAAAYAQYTAISETLMSKLDDLYDLGKKMGKAVANGYADATAGIPQAARGGAGAQSAMLRSSAPSVTVNVTGAIDPVGTARQIRRILATGDLRSGRGQ